MTCAGAPDVGRWLDTLRGTAPQRLYDVVLTATLNPAFVGLAFWATGTRTRFDVDTYRVWRTPRDPA